MKSILTFLLIILMDIQFNYACPCNPTNTLIEMNESFASQFQIYHHYSNVLMATVMVLSY